jgi:hypothetical protein
MPAFLDYANTLSRVVTITVEAGITALENMFAIPPGQSAFAGISRAFDAFLATVPPMTTGIIHILAIIGAGFALDVMIVLAAIALARGIWLTVVGAAVIFAVLLVVLLAIVWLWVFCWAFCWVVPLLLRALGSLAGLYIRLINDPTTNWANVRRRLDEI